LTASIFALLFPLAMLSMLVEPFQAGWNSPRREDAPDISRTAPAFDIFAVNGIATALQAIIGGGITFASSPFFRLGELSAIDALT